MQHEKVMEQKTIVPPPGMYTKILDVSFRYIGDDFEKNSVTVFIEYTFLPITGSDDIATAKQGA